MVKKLLVFCDGTGMDGALAPPKSASRVQDSPAVVLQSQDELEGGGGGDIQYPTNILRLSRSVKSHDQNGNEQIVFYQSGVGSEADFKGKNITPATLLQATGTAVASKIRDAYVFVAQNFDDGDEICLFGFSRGAYTARKLAGLIDRIGLLTRHNLGYFFQIWRDLVDKKKPTIPDGTRHPKIKCVGVFDTVGSVLNQIDALSIEDTSLPATVQYAFHAVSLQENRQKFLPTLWTIPKDRLDSKQVQQIWFPGAHSDVGGGYERHELADISLNWLAGEIKAASLIDLDYDFLRSYHQTKPDPWGTSQPHNAYEETDWKKYIVGHETRLKSGDIKPQSMFHSSIQSSPQKLTSPEYMITMSNIEQKFGPDFVPQYPPLNDFEQFCKNNWKTPLTGPNLPAQDVLDSPSVLIRPERF